MHWMNYLTYSNEANINREKYHRLNLPVIKGLYDGIDEKFFPTR